MSNPLLEIAKICKLTTYVNMKLESVHSRHKAKNILLGIKREFILKVAGKYMGRFGAYNIHIHLQDVCVWSDQNY